MLKETRDYAVYALVDPRNREVRYVGCCLSKRLNKRFGQHKCPDEEVSNHKKATWVRSLLRVGMKPELVLLEIVVAVNWEERERHWIRLYRTRGHRLTNLTEGGKGPLGFMKSEKTKLKHHSFRHTAEMKERLRQCLKGVPKSDLHKKNVSLSKLGKPWSEKQRVAITAAVAKNPKCRARYRKGEANGRSVLTELDVIELRKVKGTASYRELAKRFNVGICAIKRASNGSSWRHV